MISTEFFTAVKSDTNIDASNKFCLLINQMIGALLQNNNIPVQDCLVRSTGDIHTLFIYTVDGVMYIQYLYVR